MEKISQTPFLTAKDAAEFLQIKLKVLNAMRWRGEGPHYRKHGATVVYHKDDLMGWSRERDFGYGPGYDIRNPDHTENRLEEGAQDKPAETP